MQFENIWNPFEDDEPVPISCPAPETLEEAYLRFLARKFGRPIEDERKTCVLLYGDHALQGANTEVYDAQRKKAAAGEKFVVPKWLTRLRGAFRAHYESAMEDARNRGVRHGKRLLMQLAAGEITVNTFEDETRL